MVLVTISGYRASGKGETGLSLLESLKSKGITKVTPCTSREPRDGEVDGRDYYFITDEELALKETNGEFVFLSPPMYKENKFYRSGTTLTELKRCNFGFIDILPSGARLMKKYIEENNLGHVLTIFMHADEEQRIQRVIAREPHLASTPDVVRKMISEDAVTGDISEYTDFDLVIKNPDGRFEQTVLTIEKVIKRFLISCGHQRPKDGLNLFSMTDFLNQKRITS